MGGLVNVSTGMCIVRPEHIHLERNSTFAGMENNSREDI
jgi:hypothetical protein